jgi:precorrin-8X/cobalt-precorrin-8 methylmutase
VTLQTVVGVKHTESADSIADYSIVLAGHGSRDAEGIDEFEQMAEMVRVRSDKHPVYHGFLEFAEPTITEAVEKAIADGAEKIVVVPGLLAAATHAKNDMPGELNLLKQTYPKVDFHFGSAMDLHPHLLRLSQQRIIEAEAKSNNYVSRADTCLVVVGRGTSDPDANSEISKLTRMLEEGMGFGTSFVCYSGTARPAVRDGLTAAAKLGHRRIVVFPYFLFDGVLVKRVYAAADTLQKQHPELEVLKAGYLGVHEDVADVFLERALEGVEGRATMNCSLCKYRVQIVGFESQVGTPQSAHHLKMRASLSQSEGKPIQKAWKAYEPHPIEKESFRIIESERDWSDVPEPERAVVQRLVHTSGDFAITENLFFSPGSVDSGVRSLLRCRVVVTDVTMVESGFKRALLEELGIKTWCGVHDRETEIMARESNLTRSAAGIRRAFELFGNNVIVAIGDAPTALSETLRLVNQHNWRPQLVIGLPVGFVGTRESKEELIRCLNVPRISNRGTRGGSPWASAVINALMIQAIAQLAEGSIR